MMHAGRFGSFDPSLRQYQQQQQFNILQQQPPYSTQGQQSNPEPITDGLLANIEVPTSETIPEQDLSSSVLPQPTAGLTLPIVRSSSHPGLQRVHAHGSSSRAESPAPSNVSFHGNGHPRRASARAPFASGGSHDSRSSSSGAEVSFRPQRVPSAQDFPALNGTTSPNGDKADSPIANGKTAAQVLSLPAPSKPVSAKVSPSNGHDDGDHEVSPSIRVSGLS